MYTGKLVIEKTLQTPESNIPQNPVTGFIKAGQIIKLTSENSSDGPFFSIITVDQNSATIKCEKLSPEPELPPNTTEFSLKISDFKTFYYQSINGLMIFTFRLVEIKEEANIIPPKNSSVNLRMPMHYFNNVQTILANLEKTLNSKVIVYYMPPSNMISKNDPEYFLEVLKKSEKYPKISLILHSPGGDSMASYRIANLLRQYCQELEIIIPAMAASAATNLSLGADILKFSPLGYLSPIDTQQINITDERLVKLGYNVISSDSYRRAKEMLDKDVALLPNGSYSELFKYIHPLVISEVDRMSSKSKLIATKMMKMQSHPPDDAKIDKITSHLVYDYPAHGFPILLKEAQEIGLNAEALPEDVYYQIWDLFKFYRSITRNQLTHINTEKYHVEVNEVVIEAVGKRVVRRFSYDRIFSIQERRWQMANDNSDWKKYITSEDPSKSPLILNIEKDSEPVVTPA